MSHALVPHAISSSRLTHPSLALAGVGALGVLALSALAQITIPLPWTPVPITGQTFGVALLALIGGRRLALASVAVYLGLGLNGLPVLAHGSAFVPGASSGYLLGMLVAATVVGALADRGWARTWGGALAAAYVGSAITFACGLVVLSRFVPSAELLGAGLFPFLIGDLVKNVAAASLAAVAAKRTA